MISAGNDIVALNAINIHRTQQYGFYSKILSGPEQEFYKHDRQIPFEQYVWQLWSIKESAYKFMQRHSPQLVFSPTRVIVQSICMPVDQPTVLQNKLEGMGFDNSFYTGKVNIQSTELYFNSMIAEDFILTVVNNRPAFENVYWGIQRISPTDPASQSGAVRALVLEKLTTMYSDASFQIIKSPAGFPLVTTNGIEMNMALSLAHHEHFISYSFTS